MHRGKGLATKTYILLILMVSIGSVGNAILDKGMKNLGAIDISTRNGISSGLLRTLASGTIWTGIACMLFFMLCQMLVLSWADYSFVMPFTAISYALVPVLAFFYLGEQVPATRWMGIALIVFGVLLVSRTPPRTTASGADANTMGLR